MVDPMLQSFNKEEVTRVIGVAFLCTQASPALRPPMSRVVAMLSGDIDVNEVTSRPSYLTDWHSNDTTKYASSSHATETSAEMSVRGHDILPSLENKESFPPSPSDPILHKCMNEGR